MYLGFGFIKFLFGKLLTKFGGFKHNKSFQDGIGVFILNYRFRIRVIQLTLFIEINTRLKLSVIFDPGQS